MVSPEEFLCSQHVPAASRLLVDAVEDIIVFLRENGEELAEHGEELAEWQRICKQVLYRESKRFGVTGGVQENAGHVPERAEDFPAGRQLRVRAFSGYDHIPGPIISGKREQC